MKFESSLIKILIIFFVSFFLLFGLYQAYLYYYNTVLQTVDPITNCISESAAYLLNISNFDTKVVHPNGKPYNWLYIDNQYSTIVNEGCNGISVGILLVSFLLAFHTSFKQTLGYILISLLILLFLNVIRVEALSYVYRFENQRFKLAHEIIFPVLIYGYVLIVWLIWMKFFVFKNKKWNEAK